MGSQRNDGENNAENGRQTRLSKEIAKLVKAGLPKQLAEKLLKDGSRSQ